MIVTIFPADSKVLILRIKITWEFYLLKIVHVLKNSFILWFEHFLFKETTIWFKQVYF